MPSGSDEASTKYVRSFPPDGTPDPPAAADNAEVITATIPEAPGEFSWTITDHAVDLGTATNQGSYWESTGDLNPVTVTDTRAGAPAWSVSGQVGDFTGGLDGKYLGWSPKVVTAGAGAVAGSVPVTVGDTSPPATNAPDASTPSSAAQAPAFTATLPASTSPGLIVQNSLDNQAISATTTIDTSVNTAHMLESMRVAESVHDAVIQFRGN